LRLGQERGDGDETSGEDAAVGARGEDFMQAFEPVFLEVDVEKLDVELGAPGGKSSQVGLEVMVMAEEGLGLLGIWTAQEGRDRILVAQESLHAVSQGGAGFLSLDELVLECARGAAPGRQVGGPL